MGVKQNMQNQTFQKIRLQVKKNTVFPSLINDNKIVIYFQKVVYLHFF